MSDIQRVFQTRVAMVVLILSLTVNQITLTAGWFISQHLSPPTPLQFASSGFTAQFLSWCP